MAATAGTYVWPLDAPTHITGTFGEYRDNHLHNGIDFSALGQRGRPVKAVASGQVDEIFYKPETYGLTVIIRHNDGRRSWYAHLDAVAGSIKNELTEIIRPGVSISPVTEIKIEKGETIGSTGDTGRGPVHLHFTLEDSKGNFINPVGYFNPPLPFNPQPRLGKVYLYPLDGNSWVNGKARPVNVEDNEVILWGNLGIEIETWNFHPGTTNRTLPRKIVLEVDGEPVNRLVFDTLPVSTYEKPVTTVYNRELSNLSPTRYFLDLTPRGDNPAGGIKFDKRGDSGNLRFLIYPDKDNEPLIEEITYRVKEPYTSGDLPGGERFRKKMQGDKTDWSRQDYSTFLPGEAGDTAFKFDYRWQGGRLKFELELEIPRPGWPLVKILKEDEVIHSLEPVQVEPGRFLGWWSPGIEKEGWHILEVILDEDPVEKDRVFLQSFRTGLAQVAVDSTGRYSIFTSGEGLKYEGPINFKTVKNYPSPRAGLEVVEPPRLLTPRRVQSIVPMIIETTMNREITSPDNIMFYSWNPTAEKWEIIPEQSRLTARHRSAEIYSFKKVALLRDTRFPRIAGANVGPRGKLHIKFRDNQSGITAEGVKIETKTGETVNFFWDPHDKKAMITPGQFSELPGGSKFRVEVTNRAGLKTTGEVSVP